MQFKRWIKYLFLLVLIGVLGFLYSFTTVRNSNRKVTDIQVKFIEGNNNFLTHDMVDKLLIQNEETVRNQAKSKLDLYKLEKKVIENPYVEESAVFCTIDGALKATVKQRTPIARILAENDTYYIDKYGVKIPLSNNFSARVLLVTALKNNKEIKLVLPLISKIINDEFLKKEIVGIEKSSEGNYRFAVRSGNYKIEFGKLEELEVKFKKLKAFYNTTFKDKKIQEYKLINVKYHNQVVCTK